MSQFPSDEALIEFLTENPSQSGKREVARAFGIKGADRITLKQRLKALRDAGRITKDGSSFRLADRLPPVFPAEAISVDDDGDLLVVPKLAASEEKVPQRFILTEKRNAAKKIRGRSTEPPGVGDRILVRLVKEPEGDAPGEVSFVKAIGRSDVRHYGVFRIPSHGPAYIEPVDRKADQLTVSEHDFGDAKNGDLVAAVRLAGTGRRKSDNAKIEQVYGQLGSERAISQIAVLRQGVPDEFPQELLSTVDALEPAGIGSREDWRNLPLITIDPADAKDHDDAVHAASDTDPDNEGGFVVTVAIADVAYYVRPHSNLDREARRRGNSVYFPDRVIPMLPERLSTDLCSLKAGEDRPALAIQMVFSSDGTKKRHSLHRVWITLHAGLAYEAAQAAIDGKSASDDITPCPAQIHEDVLKPLWAAYNALRAARDKRSPLQIDLPERKLLLDEAGKVKGVHVPERLDAHKLIEEFMIQANVAAAELLEAKKTAALYRVHDAPNTVKFEGLRAFLKSLNISVAGRSALRPRDFNGILERAKETPNEALVNEMVLRSQAQAEYTPDNIGHFGLNLGRYAHFTSPIRRYADLLVHRALLHAYDLSDGDDGAATPNDVLERLGDHLSGTERRAMLAERETKDRLVAALLADRIGATFDGRITGIVGAGVFVRLDETGADGFVPVSQLGPDYFTFDEASQRLVGSATGRIFQLGDTVSVKLLEAAPLAGALRFEMLSEGKAGKPIKAGRAVAKRGQRLGAKKGKPGASRSPAAHARRAIRKAQGR